MIGFQDAMYVLGGLSFVTIGVMFVLLGLNKI